MENNNDKINELSQLLEKYSSEISEYRMNIRKLQKKINDGKKELRRLENKKDFAKLNGLKLIRSVIELEVYDYNILRKTHMYLKEGKTVLHDIKHNKLYVKENDKLLEVK